MTKRQPSRYTKEDVLDAIAQFIGEKGEEATGKRYREEKRKPYPPTINKYFGSWKNAYAEAKKQPQKQEDTNRNNGVRYGYSDEELLASVRRFVEENNGNTSSKLYTQQNRIPTYATIFKRLGKWEEVLLRAGCLDNRRKSEQEAIEQALESIRTFVKENNGDTNSNRYIEQKRRPSLTFFYTHFGTWKEAVEQAGCIYQEPNKQLLRVPRKDMLAAIQAFVKENDGWTSSQGYIDQKRKPCYKTILREFDTWEEAIAEAGFTPLLKNTNHWTKADIVDGLRAFVEDNNGCTSSQLYIDQKRNPSYQMVIALFRTWKNAMEQAGYHSNPSNMKQRCIKSIQAFAEEKGQEATSRLYREEKRKPVLLTIEKYFGSWEKACLEANVLEKSKQ